MTLKYAYACAVSLFILLPIYWVAITAFKPASEILAYPPIWFPTKLTLDSFDVAVGHFNGLTALKNSLIVASGSTILAMVIGTPAGYGMARFNVGGRALARYLLTQRMIPAVAIIFPSFILFQAIGWGDTYQALIVIYAAAVMPFTVWMARSYILEIPREVEESAIVDGCNTFGVLYHITVPLAAPGLATTAIFVFVFGWIERRDRHPVNRKQNKK